MTPPSKPTLRLVLRERFTLRSVGIDHSRIRWVFQAVDANGRNSLGHVELYFEADERKWTASKSTVVGLDITPDILRAALPESEIAVAMAAAMTKQIPADKVWFHKP